MQQVTMSSMNLDDPKSGRQSPFGGRFERGHYPIYPSVIQRDRHRVPVGLTGLAQVSGLRGDTSIEDRAWFDNHYIENWSVSGDLIILARTAGAVIKQVRE